MGNRGAGILLDRRQVLAGLLATAATPALGASRWAPTKSLYPQPRPGTVRAVAAHKSLDALLAGSNLSGEQSVVAIDVESGAILESHKPLLSLPPASVAKTATTLYALDKLGADHRFQTRIIASKPPVNGRVDGDLILAGSGDPTLDSDALGDLARQLKDAGIREVTGKFKVYSGAIPYVSRIDRAQPDYLGYNPSVSGLNLNFNRVFFEWKRAGSGYNLTMQARAIRYRPAVQSARVSVVDSQRAVFAYKDVNGIEQWTVAKRALRRNGGRWLPVRNPEAYAADVFRTLARSFGIVLPAATLTRQLQGGTVLATWQSQPLKVVLKAMLKHSTNITAEAVGLAASRAAGARPGSLRASAKLMSAWLKQTHGAKHARFVDHSGLGEDSRISARDMVRILRAAARKDELRPILKQIKITDAQGKPLKNQPAHIVAKTGTLNFASNLAGYEQLPNGRTIAFAIFTADLPMRKRIPKAERERPRGGHAWNRRSKGLQQQLLTRWIAEYG